MTRKGRTTIEVKKSTRDRLASVKYDRGDDSYDETVNRLLEERGGDC